MRSLPLPVVLGVATLGAGCLKLNPAFDSQGAPTDAGSISGEPTDTNPATTSSTSASPTSDDPTTGGPTSDGPTSTSGDPTTGGVDPASTGMSSETGSTTGGPTGCWDQPIDAFTLSPLLLEVFGAGSPSLSPDGRNLYFRAPTANYVEVRRLHRDDPAADFVAPSEKFFGPDDTIDLDYPEVVAGENKILFTQKGGDIYAARIVNGMWGTWKIAGTTEAFDPNDVESHPNATEDGAILLFQRDDGPAIGPVDGTFHFYQTVLDGNLDTFNTEAVDVTPTHADLVIPLCPAMSPDGLRLLFAAKDAAGDLQQFNDGSVGVWSTRRAAVGDEWEPPVRSTVREPGWITCPTSITDDGCQATFVRFTHPQSTYTMHLGRRG